jgi:hypothetical protein
MQRVLETGDASFLSGEEADDNESKMTQMKLL